MDATNAISHAIDATNAISPATHATNAISHVISHCITIETPHQFYLYNLSSKRVFALCIKQHRQADPVAMVPWPGCGSGDNGVNAMTLEKEAAKGVLRKGM